MTLYKERCDAMYGEDGKDRSINIPQKKCCNFLIKLAKKRTFTFQVGARCIEYQWLTIIATLYCTMSLLWINFRAPILP